MKKLVLILAIISFFACEVNAQMKQITVVDPQGNTVFYSNLYLAISNAPQKSDIIIPGGNYDLGAQPNKELHFYGVGHYPGSNAGNSEESKTVIIVNDRMSFGEGSDNSSISGIEIMGNGFYIGANVKNILVFRCKAKSIQLWSNANSIKIRECIFNEIAGNYGDNNNIILEKNIVGTIGGMRYSLIANNIVTGGDNNYGIYNNSNCLIINNICLSDNGLPWNLNSNIINNVCSFAINEPLGGTNTFLNNRYSISLSELFVNPPLSTFDYNNNYHILSPWTMYAAAYGENAAGLEVGIYGTKYPYKAEDGKSALPVIPNITSSNISNTLNSEGKLEVNVTVKAQTK